MTLASTLKEGICSKPSCSRTPIIRISVFFLNQAAKSGPTKKVRNAVISRSWAILSSSTEEYENRRFCILDSTEGSYSVI